MANKSLCYRLYINSDKFYLVLKLVFYRYILLKFKLKYILFHSKTNLIYNAMRLSYNNWHCSII